MLEYLIHGLHGLYLCTGDVVADYTSNPALITFIPVIMLILFSFIIVQLVYWLIVYGKEATIRLLEYIVNYDEIQLQKRKHEMVMRMTRVASTRSSNFSMRSRKRG